MSHGFFWSCAKLLLKLKKGEQGWRSGESARLPPMWPGFEFRTGRQMWVEFVVGSRPCSERFIPGTPVFPSPQKPTFLNSSLIWTQWMAQWRERSSPTNVARVRVSDWASDVG